MSALLRRATLALVLCLGCSDPAHRVGVQADEDALSDAASPDAATGLDAGSPTPPQHHDAGREPPPAGYKFPSEFVFGSAVAGFQVDMGCPTLPSDDCVDKRSDWYAFTTDAQLVMDEDVHLSGHDPARVSPGFWELFPEDIRRAKQELHHDAFRFSIEWSRIFPNATDDADTPEEVAALADPRAVKKYHQILAELKKHGMRPLVTLYHYALPIWIHDPVKCHTDFDSCTERGWVDRERTIREIQKYTAFCAREFGAEIDWWATLNEPLQNMLFGYVQPSAQRSHPPALSLNTDAARIVFNALIDAHARMYDALKQHDTVDADGDGDTSFVGVVYPLTPIVAENPGSLFDGPARDNIDYLWNRAFLNAVTLGKYDPKLDRTIEQREDLAGRMDYVGINYYFSIQVKDFFGGISVPIISALSPLFTADPGSFKEIPNDPDELAGLIHWVNDELGVPAIITENGVPDPDDNGTTARFLVQNLAAVQRAIAEGADVRGYFYWTLMDNYEWNHGMGVRMGLYAVEASDPTKRRVARRAVPVFAEIARHKLLSFEMLSKYGAGP
jgi:beta-galactosidase